VTPSKSSAPALTAGTVYLVGAGPGDPDLLTLKALRLLRSADAVVYDYLVNASILEETRPDCERVFVGKKGRHFCRPQAEIDSLLISLAGQGKQVVRLKGGDPFIFGRGGEEAEVLAAHGIRFEIVPGVTAALGAAAAIGVPLTHRAHASSVVFLTGHESTANPEGVRWEDFARLQSTTLCIYMGMHHLQAIVSRLMRGGLAEDTPAAIVHAATTDQHRQVFATLGTLVERSEKGGLSAPAVVIIGEVVSHAASFASVAASAWQAASALSEAEPVIR
jgi:uroporphyrin-III C-methyltransferase